MVHLQPKAAYLMLGKTDTERRNDFWIQNLNDRQGEHLQSNEVLPPTAHEESLHVEFTNIIWNILIKHHR